jgi:galactokinase
MRVIAPGRVNLIGDHTDYTGGLVFPMAIDRYTTIAFEHSESTVLLTSADDPDPVSYRITDSFDPTMTPRWGRYVAAVTSLIHNPRAITGTVTTTIPVGAGLSSSAALEVAIGLACGASSSPIQLAQLTQRAEFLATGVPTGIMDQLCIASAQEGHGTLIDCRSLEVKQMPIPNEVEFVVRFIAHRTLEGSEYATRVAQCAAAEKVIGPLRDATIEKALLITNDEIRRRAQHVISENERVLMFTRALQAKNFVSAGHLMTDSHWSLSQLYETSTPQMDAAVNEVLAQPGVYGARMTGGGFGGCIVAMVQPATALEGWRVRPVSGATLLSE